MTPGMIIPIDGGGTPIVFQYNPMETHWQYGSEFAQIEVQGKEGPLLEFANGSLTSLSFDLQVIKHASDHDVQGIIDALVGLTKPIAGGAGTKRAPKVRFVYGMASPKWNAYVKSVNVKTIDAMEGSLLPHRATISVTLWRSVD